MRTGFPTKSRSSNRLGTDNSKFLFGIGIAIGVDIETDCDTDTDPDNAVRDALSSLHNQASGSAGGPMA
jgi:hypothetical protein